MLVSVILPLEVKIKSNKIKLKKINENLPSLYHKNINDFFHNNIQSYEVEDVYSYEVEYEGDKEEFVLEKCYIDILQVNNNNKFNDIILVNLKINIKEEQLYKLKYVVLNRYPDCKLKTKLKLKSGLDKYLFSTEKYNMENISNLLFENRYKLDIVNYPLGFYSYLIYDYHSNEFLQKVEKVLDGLESCTSEISLLYEFSDTPFRNEYIEKINRCNVLKKSKTNLFILSDKSFGRINSNSRDVVINKYIYFTKLVLLQKVGMLMFQSRLKEKPKNNKWYINSIRDINNYINMIITGKDIKGYKEYFNFISYYYFYEISSEAMPIELYTMLQKNLGVYNHYEKVNAEMEMQYSMLNERRLSHIEIFIAILGIIVALIGISVALK